MGKGCITKDQRELLVDLIMKLSKKDRQLVRGFIRDGCRSTSAALQPTLSQEQACHQKADQSDV